MLGKLTVVFMIGLLMVAFWLRIDQLESLPPGLSTDEAINVVDGFTIAHTGKLPFFEDVYRPEHAYRFFTVIGVWLLGPSVWAFRLVAAFTGTLSVAAAYWAARECVHDQPPPVRALAGLGAAASLAVALSHVVLSRAVYRAIPQPLFMFIFVALLMRSLRASTARRRRDAVMSGIMLGLALHTYTAALILPAALPVMALSLVIFRRKTWRTWLPPLVLLGVTLAVLAAPIGYMLLTNSDRVLTRSSDVEDKLTADNARDRIERLWDHFFTAGDINSQYNADRAPLLPPVFDWVFLVGLVALVVRVRHPASALIAAMLVLGTIPMLASGEIPHGLRIMGEFAVFPLIIGTGLAFALALVRSLPERAHPGAYGLTLALLAAITLADGIDARSRYVAWWDNNDHPWQVYGRELIHGEWFFRTDLRDLGRWLSEQDEALLVPLDELDRAALRAWLLDAYPNVSATADDETFDLPLGTRLVVPWALELDDLQRETRHYGLLHGDTITLLPPFDDATHRALLDGIDAAQAVYRPNGDLMLRVVPVPDDTALVFEPRTPTAAPAGDPIAAFEGGAAVIGWRGPDTIPASGNQSITVTVDWTADESVRHYYSAFVQLQTQDYGALSGEEGLLWRWLYNPTQWQAGDSVSKQYTLAVPADPSPGAYRLVTGLYIAGFPADRQRVARSVYPSLDDMATIGWIKVPQPAVPPLDPDAIPVDAVLGDRFALRSARASQADNGDLHVTLLWEALDRRPPLDATVFIHALDGTGAMVAQSDIRPWNGQYPTFIWDDGERVVTEHVLPLGEVPPDGVRLVAGMYTFPGPARLPVVQPDPPVDGGPLGDDVILLGTADRLIVP